MAEDKNTRDLPSSLFLWGLVAKDLGGWDERWAPWYIRVVLSNYMYPFNKYTVCTDPEEYVLSEEDIVSHSTKLPLLKEFLEYLWHCL